MAKTWSIFVHFAHYFVTDHASHRQGNARCDELDPNWFFPRPAFSISSRVGFSFSSNQNWEQQSFFWQLWGVFFLQPAPNPFLFFYPLQVFSCLALWHGCIS